MRLWTLERIAGAYSVVAFAGTHWAVRYARAIGCRVGADVELHALPPVTGLASFGSGCTVEPEVDLAGWWLDGDVLHVGEIAIGADTRVGARSTVLPGARVPDGAEIPPGSSVTASDVPVVSGDWPTPRHNRGWKLAYTLSMIGLGALPLLVSVPWMLLGYQVVRDDSSLSSALGHLVVITPLATVAAVVSYAGLVVLLVRLAGLGSKPGLHPARGRVAWCVWLTDRLMRSARVTLFPMYASLATPAWLRALGARIGRGVEASTVVTVPRLTRVADGSFLADDGLLAPFESRGGWLRLGHVRVGERAFLGTRASWVRIGPFRTVR